MIFECTIVIRAQLIIHSVKIFKVSSAFPFYTELTVHAEVCFSIRIGSIRNIRDTLDVVYFNMQIYLRFRVLRLHETRQVHKSTLLYPKLDKLKYTRFFRYQVLFHSARNLARVHKSILFHPKRGKFKYSSHASRTLLRKKIAEVLSSAFSFCRENLARVHKSEYAPRVRKWGKFKFKFKFKYPPGSLCAVNRL